ncbi:Hypothetical predicted protein [Paramuricea clavata]|uniref:Uncharacterized protein n=1 Tax=Paramuricea clavata TaxID=317549 RepID=A0A7D9LM92_PARCT|nr:Hypothetical predicted protein [Paramuricea clavata]
MLGKLVASYNDILQGIGKLKGVKVTLHIDETVKPVAQKHKRVPFHLGDKVEAELSRLEEAGINETVDSATDWISPIVIAPKKDSNEIRISRYFPPEDDHYRALSATFQRLRESGLTLKRSTCEFGKTSIMFFGLVFSDQGISTDPEKVEALQHLSAPSNQAELRSFLGMANYSSQFIHNYATIVAPLRDLTRKNVVYQPGKLNPADYTSRQPLPLSRCSKRELKESAELEAHVNWVVTNDVPPSLKIKEIRSATHRDPVLCDLYKIIENQHGAKFDGAKFRQYRNVAEELSIAKGVILRFER